jgi:hypothetical protein
MVGAAAESVLIGVCRVSTQLAGVTTFVVVCVLAGLPQNVFGRESLSEGKSDEFYQFSVPVASGSVRPG